LTNSQTYKGWWQFLIFIICCLALVLSPSVDVVPFVVNSYDEKRVLEILLVITVLLHQVVRGRRLHGYAYSSLLVFLLLFVSSCFASFPRLAFLDVTLFIGLFFFVDFVKNAWLKNAGQTLNYVVVAACLGAFLFILSGDILTLIMGYLLGFHEKVWTPNTSPFYRFTNVRFFNQYQLFIFPLMAIPLILNISIISKYKKTLFGLLVCWWVLLFLTGGRGTLIAITAAILVSFLVYRRASIAFVKIQGLAAVSGIIVYALLNNFVYVSKATTILRSYDSRRLDLWERAIDLIVQNPFFGVGGMHYAWQPNPLSNHPHNSVLQIAAEWGLPAALAVIGLFFYSLACWVRRYNYKTVSERNGEVNPQVIVVLFCSLLAGAIYSLVSGVIVMPLSQIMAALVIGLMFGVYQSFDAEKGGLPMRTGKKGLAIKTYLSRFLAGITLAIFVWTVMPSLLPRVLDGKAFLTKCFKHPRFWAAGEIPFNGVVVASQMGQQPSPMLLYYAVINGDQVGPYDINTIKEMIFSNQLTKNTLVWRKGMVAWSYAECVAELKSIWKRPTTIATSISTKETNRVNHEKDIYPNR
jgi:putative inorganic carbon (HCO3(-)) transporter